MSRPRRFPRIDYSVYNDVGRKTAPPPEANPQPPQPDQPTSSEVEDTITTQFHNLTLDEMSKPSEFIMDTNVIISEIQDVIDESPVHPDYVSNFDSVTSTLATLRLSLKKKQQLILAENLEHQLLPKLTQALDSIKLHIQRMAECKSKAQLAKLGDQSAVYMQRSMCFAIEDLIFKIRELQKDFDKPIHDLSDAELIQLKSDLPMQIDQVNKIAKKYESILQQPIHKAELLQDITDIGQRYENLLKSKSAYQSSINDAIVNQDVYKNKLFNQSKLNIRLEKFSGHQDSTDFYTFKSNFLKLHERGTPKHLLPDLLINNYLKDPALSLVKSIKDIDTIWDRLKFSYGDVKMMLTKKLNQLSSMDSLFNLKDHEAISLSLSKLVVTMKESITLAEQHKIEHNLYFSDGLVRIYNLLDESRLSRWLRAIADEDKP
ncbi:uncharacterized protein [Clytia hemisphaerica]|uniref:uncharacterized protein n=1 Tax=Clytia hemisphaerica TaxID=252671 RepID=UPI0034D4D36F